MKTLFLILIFISFNSFAGYVSGLKANQCDRKDYVSASVCQELESESCYKVPGDSGECGIFKLKDIYGNVKFDEESCAGQSACESLLPEKVCGVGRYALIDEDYSEVYCVEVIGKELVIDQALKAVKDAQKLAKDQMDAALASARKIRDCGAGIIDLFLVRNAPKNLSIQQVEELSVTFAPIQNLLLNGSLVTAKTKILEAPVDGVKVTEADKAALAAAADKCLGL